MLKVQIVVSMRLIYCACYELLVEFSILVNKQNELFSLCFSLFLLQSRHQNEFEEGLWW